MKYEQVYLPLLSIQVIITETDNNSKCGKEMTRLGFMSDFITKDKLTHYENLTGLKLEIGPVIFFSLPIASQLTQEDFNSILQLENEKLKAKYFLDYSQNNIKDFTGIPRAVDVTDWLNYEHGVEGATDYEKVASM